MGADVVEIGIRHRLPVQDPKKLAQEMATIFNTNVKVVALNEFEYDDVANKIIDPTMDDVFIPLFDIAVDESSKYLQLIVVDYQKKQIRIRLSPSQLQSVSFSSPDVKQDFNTSWDNLYDAEFFNGDDECSEYSEFYIYQENIEIPYYIPGRWYNFIDYFKSPEYLDILKEIRMKVGNLAKKFGCNSIIYCSDQTVSARIWDNMEMPASSLLMYAKTGAFIESEEKKKYSKARIINLDAFLKGEEHLEEDEYVEAVIDDF